MTTYFLSYARADSAIALRFANDLKAAGVSVWVDQYDILPSQHWDRAVETAVRGCRGLLIILSPRSVASSNVADEVSVAIDDGKEIVPVMIEACTLPLRMTRMHFIDATKDYDAALRRVLAATQGHALNVGRLERPAEAPAPLVSALDAQVVAEAERRLTGLIGPIAERLVRQAARKAQSPQALYEELANSLSDPAERRSFLSWLTEPLPPGRVVTPRREAKAPSAPELGLDTIAVALTRYLGPIARQLVKREQAVSASREELCERLALKIPSDKDRAAFLKEVAEGR